MPSVTWPMTTASGFCRSFTAGEALVVMQMTHPRPWIEMVLCMVQDATPQLAALNGRPCQLFFNSAAMESVAMPGHVRSAADSKADQLNVRSPPAATPGEEAFCSTCLVCSSTACCLGLALHCTGTDTYGSRCSGFAKAPT